MHSPAESRDEDHVVNDEHERAADDNAVEQTDQPTRREALGRFAKYTAPIMLGMLLSEQAAAITGL